MALRKGGLAHDLSSLQCGESFSRTMMMGRNDEVDLVDEIREAKRRLRNHLTKHVDRASKATGAMFRMDCASWHAPEDAAIFVTVAVTRIM